MYVKKVTHKIIKSYFEIYHCIYLNFEFNKSYFYIIKIKNGYI